MAASVFNITSAVFDGQAMGRPISGQVGLRGTVVNQSTGTQAFVTAQKLVQRKSISTVAFADIDDVASMQDKIGESGTLIIIIPNATTGIRTATITNAMLVDVVAAGAHAEFGTHVAIFEAISTDGAANPVSWS